MLIPSEYVLEEGKEAPEGTVVKKCEICGKSYALPKDVAEKVGETNVCNSESCKETYDKKMAEAAAALMKPPTDAADTISKALGQ